MAILILMMSVGNAIVVGWHKGADRARGLYPLCHISRKCYIFSSFEMLQEMVEFIFEEISPKHLLSKELCIEITG